MLYKTIAVNIYVKSGKTTELLAQGDIESALTLLRGYKDYPKRIATLLAGIALTNTISGPEMPCDFHELKKGQRMGVTLITCFAALYYSEERNNNPVWKEFVIQMAQHDVYIEYDPNDKILPFSIKEILE